MRKTLLVLIILSLLCGISAPVRAQPESGIDALLQSVDSVLRNIATLIFPPREPTVRARLVDIKMLYNTGAFLGQLREAGSAAFATSAIGDLELGLQQRTAVWDNASLRNAYDDYAEAARLAGPLLLGTAVVLSARGAGNRDIVIGLSAAGALGMISGEALRLWHGTGSRGEQARRRLQAQLELSRRAYDDIRIRQLRYQQQCGQAQALLAGLDPLMAQAASLQAEFEGSGVITRPQADTIVALIDRTVELSDRYGALFGATRSAAAELRASCEVYAAVYPELAPTLALEIARIDTVSAHYDRLIDEPVISKLPLMKEKLFRWRASYAP
jgi:hypothetical protein